MFDRLARAQASNRTQPLPGPRLRNPSEGTATNIAKSQYTKRKSKFRTEPRYSFPRSDVKQIPVFREKEVYMYRHIFHQHMEPSSTTTSLMHLDEAVAFRAHATTTSPCRRFPPIPAGLDLGGLESSASSLGTHAYYQNDPYTARRKISKWVSASSSQQRLPRYTLLADSERCGQISTKSAFDSSLTQFKPATGVCCEGFHKYSGCIDWGSG